MENSLAHWSLGVGLWSKYFLPERRGEKDLGHLGKERCTRVGGAYIAEGGEKAREEPSTEFWEQSLQALKQRMAKANDTSTVASISRRALY